MMLQAEPRRVLVRDWLLALIASVRQVPGSAAGVLTASMVIRGDWEAMPHCRYPTAAQILGIGACNYCKPMNIKGNCLFYHLSKL